MNTQIDRLSGDYIIHQPVEGQRYTTDDMLVAWLAVRELQADQSGKSTFLDLGCGLCSRTHDYPMVLQRIARHRH